MDATVIVLLALAAIAIVAVWFYMQKRRSTELKGRFGPEYEAAVHRHGDPKKAELELERRVKRVKRFEIRPLSERHRSEFLESWRRNQARFVDDPGAAVAEADNLVCDVMNTRGYPMGEFENRADDLSVDHPHVVRNYRAAHAIAERHGRGEADTEDLRRAMVFYRDLFAELLEPHTVHEEVHHR
jgi:hypothetical protein